MCRLVGSVVNCTSLSEIWVKVLSRASQGGRPASPTPIHAHYTLNVSILTLFYSTHTRTVPIHYSTVWTVWERPFIAITGSKRQTHDFCYEEPAKLVFKENPIRTCCRCEINEYYYIYLQTTEVPNLEAAAAARHYITYLPTYPLIILQNVPTYYP